MNPPVRIAFARPSIGEEEIAEVVATLRSGWIATGPRVAAFEQKFGALVGARFAIATSSCTGALHIALTGLGVRDGEVVLPTMTFAATALTAVHAGARPILADIDDETLCVDPSDVARRLTTRTKAIVGVHYAGLPCAIDALVEMARARDAWIIEDAAHAVGCWSAGRHAGTIGDAGAFSFYANKNMTTIEGGMLTTSREDLAQRARPLRLQGMSRDAWKRDAAASWRYDVVDAGFKYPMSDVQAAVGIHQLSKLADWQERRAVIAGSYRELLRDVPGIRCLPDAPDGSRHGNHLFVVRVDTTAGGRDRVAQELRAEGIESSVHFVPLHLHPYFQREWGYRDGDFPRAERAFFEILSLPMHAAITDSDIDLVVGVIRRTRVLAGG